MSSLLQHDGARSADGRKVRLLFVLRRENPRYPGSAVCGDDAETFIGPDGKTRPTIYFAYRRPVGMLGCWVQFRYCGDVHAPDLSVPISTFALPRDAVRMPDAEAFAYWTSH